MNGEQKRTHKKVEKQFKKATAALEAVPTFEASARKRSLTEKYIGVRNAVAESERADATWREAREDRKDADDAVVTITTAVIAIITAARADKLLAPAVTDGTASAPETAEYLLTNLANVPEGGLLTQALKATIDGARAADEGAAQKQQEAERNVYLAHSEFFKELQDTHGYIKVNTDPDSIARQRLKQHNGRRRSPNQDDSEDDEPIDTELTDDGSTEARSTDANSASPTPGEPKADEEEVA